MDDRAALIEAMARVIGNTPMMQSRTQAERALEAALAYRSPSGAPGVVLRSRLRWVGWSEAADMVEAVLDDDTATSPFFVIEEETP